MKLKTLTIALLSTIFIQNAVEALPPSKPTVRNKKYETIQEDPANIFSLTRAANQYRSAINKLSTEKDIGRIELERLKEWLTEMAETHYNLYKVLDEKKDPNAKLEKAYAHDFAKLRDKTTFELAKIQLQSKSPKEKLKGVSLLVEVYNSQKNSKLGEKAYKLIKENKFSD